MMDMEDEDMGSSERTPLTVEAEMPGDPVGAAAAAAARPPRFYAFHACLCAGFFGLGVVLCMLGPTLLDLADMAGGVPVKEITLVFSARSIAYLGGSILGGCLLETMENTCLMLAAAMWMVAIGSAGLPFCTQVWSMGLFMACAGVSMGLLDTAANVVTLRLWGEQAEPFVQSLHASFAVGALVAPILADQFISHGLHSDSVAAACNDVDVGSEEAWDSEGPPPPRPQQLYDPSTAAERSAGAASGSQVEWAFWISAAIMMPSALGLTYLSSGWTVSFGSADSASTGGGEKDSASAVVAATAAADDDATAAADTAAHQHRLLGLGLLIFGLYVGAEIGFGGYVFAFAVTSCSLQFSESRAATLTAVYWAAFTAGRLLAIPLSFRLSPRTLTALDVAGCLLAALIMALVPGDEDVIWSCTALFGLSLASVFPSTFTMLERWMPLSGRAASESDLLYLVMMLRAIGPI